MLGQIGASFRLYDLNILGLGVAICFLVAATTVTLYQRSLRSCGSAQSVWLLLRSLSAGVGVWSANFMAMLAYDPGVRASHDNVVLGFALLCAVCSALAGLRLVMASHIWIGRVVAGAMSGAGFAFTSFLTLVAYRPQGLAHWDDGLLILSIPVGIMLGIAGRMVAGCTPSLRRGMAGALVITIAIFATHIVGWAGLTVTPDRSLSIPAELAARPALVGIIAILTLLGVVCAIAVAANDEIRQRGLLKKLREATDAMPAALAFFDSEDRLVIWNAGYEEMFPARLTGLTPGLTFEEVLRQNMDDEAVVAAILRQRREQRTNEYQFPDGRWIRIENRSNADGGITSVGVDVTELKQHAEVLARARDEAEAANRAKSHLLAAMSHELRTPLNGVLGMAQALAADELTVVQRERVKIIRRSSEALLSVLNDLLDLSKIEASTLELELVDFDLEHLIRGVVAAFQPAATKKGLTFDWEVAEGASGCYTGDSARLRRILYNLVGNAVKFTEAGSIRLSVAREGDLVRFEVTDTGIGIAPENVAHLFDDFLRVESSLNRTMGGTGMGLAVGRQLITLMGGTIEVVSTVGYGSIFLIRVPLTQIESTTVEGQSAVEAPPGLRVLAAEDNETNQIVLTTLLGQAGVIPTLVDDGRKALEAWEAQAWDVILMDIKMPVMDGIAATKAIRLREAETGRPYTPIIAVTANAMTHQVVEYEVAGMDGFVPKPVDVTHLFAAIGQALDAAEAQATANKAEVAVNARRV